MPEIIICPGCGAEISDDCGKCLLCGKEIGAGAVPQKRSASSGAFIFMIISAIAGVIAAAALSITAGFFVVTSYLGKHWGNSNAEEIMFLFVFAFLAANVVTGGNLGYRAGRHIAVFLGMDAGVGPGISSNFLWGGYAGGFSCALLFSLFMTDPLTFGGPDKGLKFLLAFLIACVISVIAGNYWAAGINKKNTDRRDHRVTNN